VFRAERPTDRETVLTRSFAAPRARVFAALTEPALLAEWLAATGFRFAAGEVDLRVGGSLRYVFERASGRRIEVRGQFESVDPPRSFSYRESYDFSPLVVHVRTELGEHGGATTLRQVLTYDSQAERDTDFPGVAASSREAFERLARLLASG
jgi:uncharacterized protein YndB with AHSA1/START domain